MRPFVLGLFGPLEGKCSMDSVATKPGRDPMTPEDLEARFRKLRFHVAELEGEPYEDVDDDFLLFHVTALREVLERIDPRFYPFEILTWTEESREVSEDTDMETLTLRCDQDEARFILKVAGWSASNPEKLSSI